MAMAENVDQAKHVQEALRYLDQKDVKKLLRDLTESVLLRQPENPKFHMLEELWESTGRCWTPSADRSVLCSFLQQKFPSPREAVYDLVRRAAATVGARRVSFFSAPNGRGRQVVGCGEAERFSGMDFLLVDSSDQELVIGEPGDASLRPCLDLALESGSATTEDAVACLIRSSEGVEGVLVAELIPTIEAASLLPMMELLALLLGERLTSMHWEAEARRSQSVINRLLQGVEVLAKPSEEWQKNLMQSAAEVPTQVLRGDVTLKDACVWQLDKRTYVDISGQNLGSPTVLAEEAFLAPQDQPQVSCVEEVSIDSSGQCVSSREICVRLYGIGKPTVLDFLDSDGHRLDHFDLAAAEWLSKSSLRAALQARSQLHELILRKHSAEQMQSLVSELSTTANTLDLVSSIEKAVQVVTHAKKCIVYFFDNDATEVWSYPTVSVPASYRLAFGIGLPGRIASFLKENTKDQPGVLVYNDLKTCPYVDTVPFGMEDARGILIAPIKSAGKDGKPLGLIVVSDKSFTMSSDDGAQDEVRHALSFWGSGKLEFTTQDSEFMEWLASAAGSHVERLSLDLMWTKALLERDTGDSSTMKQDDQEMISEYFTAEAVSRAGGAKAKVGPVRETATVHRFVGHVASALNFHGSKGLQLVLSDADAESVRNLTPAPYADVTAWDIDYWAFTPQDEITLLINSLHQLHVFDNVTIAPGVLLHYFQAVKASYRAIPFHNFHHGMSTLHYTFKMIQVSRLWEHLGHAEMFAMIMAALCHDVDHRGYNNAFEIMTRSELALRYNDSSPLENHHCARTFEIALSKDECNFFQDLDQANYNLIRKRMIAGILATDMKHHGQHVTILKEFEVGEPSESQSQFLVEVVLHAADISNPFMPPAPSQKWCACLNEEFTLQAEKEAELGLPVTSFMSGLRDPAAAAKSLLGFIDFVIIPFTSSVFRIWPELDEMRQFLDQNRAAAAAVLEEVNNPGRKKLTTKRSWKAAAPPAPSSSDPA
ncbi:5'-cyclic phosphodiesterase 9A [Durusdinium trenchii]|uniref:Phosphodiesterase n=1 Tax=Durusdinium trenchii TaxID=1381693 RepID=A0ABP0IJZ0_9DINO